MSRAGRSLRIVVFEYFSARAPGSDPPALRRAGRAILDAVTTDLERLQGVTVVVVPPSSRPGHAFRISLRGADATLIVAPETGGILTRLLRVAIDRGVPVLGPGPRAARLAGDKLATLRLLRRAGVPVPRCARLHPPTMAGLRGRRRPFVLKPRDGCGAGGVSIIRSAGEIDAALRRARAATGRRDLLVEDHLPGIPASVSFLVEPVRSDVVGGPGRGRRIRVLALGRQRVTGQSALRYRGGVLPWRPARSPEAIRTAARAVAALDRVAGDLRGFVGVDLIVGPQGAHVLEINPRLTSSYIGLRRVMEPGPGALLCRNVLGAGGRGRLRLTGSVRFDAAGEVRSGAGRRRAGRV
jgi:predicted ATP-grasp superfamily ATP-dependent carboligase